MTWGAGTAQLVWNKLRAGRLGFYSRQGQEILLYSTACRPVRGPTQPFMQWVLGVLSPGVKRGQELWSYTSNPRHVFMALCLVN
jgi:hypothetical protein